MIAYLAYRIITGALVYSDVVNARPDLKDGIDEYLTDNGYSDLIGDSE